MNRAEAGMVGAGWPRGRVEYHEATREAAAAGKPTPMTPS
jgi:hypothetical protein